MSSRSNRVGVGAAAALGGTVLFAPSAQAATFTVTNLNDTGAGSLRQAVLDANLATGGDTVVFQSGLSGTITLASEIRIAHESLDIQGPGASQLTVSGADTTRIFYLYTFDTASEQVSISGLTLADGNANGPGGAISSTDGFNSTADLVISNSVLTSNTALEDGGAVFSDGGSEEAALRIADSTITGNATGNGGSFGGGGVSAHLTDTTIQRTTMSGNSAPLYDGGAVYFVGTNSNGPTPGLTISDSTLTGNYAGGRGGGAVVAFRWNAPLVIENSTLSGNNADGHGGAVYLYTSEDEPQIIRNTTIVGNTATDSGGGIWRYGSDNGAGGPDELSISSSIVANNTAPDGDLGDQVTEGGSGPVDGTFVLGFSLIEDDGGAAKSENPSGTNFFATDPQLGPLAANGGPTQTMLPALSSPAMDAGIANGLATDQRGLPRTADLTAPANRTGSDGTDIGAVEIQGAVCQGATVPSQTGTDSLETLRGADGPDSISALGGSDNVFGVGGADCLAGDDGADLVDGGDGDDEAAGDEGSDTVKGGPDDDLVLGGAGNDKVVGQAGNDVVKGEAGNDNVSGTGGADKVIGGEGKDTVKGGAGKDKLKGNAGKDTIKARDGEKDKVNCGGGKDKAVVDDKDKVSKNCEVVDAK